MGLSPFLSIISLSFKASDSYILMHETIPKNVAQFKRSPFKYFLKTMIPSNFDTQLSCAFKDTRYVWSKKQ